MSAAPSTRAQEQTTTRIASPYSLNQDISPGESYMGVRLLGTLKLDPTVIGGAQIGGLSALGWDQDELLLYALSDSGVMFHMQLQFDADGLLRDTRVMKVRRLQDARGRPLGGRLSDSEGLVVRFGNNGIRGDSQLAISFERRPRIVRFDMYGKMLGAEMLPAALRNIKNYRSANRALESLAWHPPMALFNRLRAANERCCWGHYQCARHRLRALLALSLGR